jgi:hypothetical protein
MAAEVIPRKDLRTWRCEVINVFNRGSIPTEGPVGSRKRERGGRSDRCPQHRESQANEECEGEKGGWRRGECLLALTGVGTSNQVHGDGTGGDSVGVLEVVDVEILGEWVRADEIAVG